MGSNTNTTGRTVSKTPVLIFVGLCTVCLTLSVVYYRVTHPFLDIREMQVSHAADQGPMADINTMMQRLEKNSNDIDALRSLGNAFMRMKAWDRAVNFWDRVLSLEPHDAMALNQKGVSLFQQQEYKIASTTFEKLLEVQPDNVYALFNLGVLYRHFLGEIPRGESYLHKILELNHENKDVLQAVEEELGTEPTQQKTEHGNEK